MKVAPVNGEFLCHILTFDENNYEIRLFHIIHVVGKPWLTFFNITIS